MKIVGGSFGLKGRAKIEGGNRLVISGTSNAAYSSNGIQSVSASIDKERKFGFVGFIIGAVLLGVLLGAFLGVLGVIIGLVLAVIGSFYTKKHNVVDVVFKDGKTVKLECSKGEVKKLIGLQA